MAEIIFSEIIKLVNYTTTISINKTNVTDKSTNILR